jgi:NAD(P)-dependent dehydrogenase (short-subunit alcohol dehydrogenase family)
VPFKPDSPMGREPPGAGSMAPTYSVSKAALNRAVQLLAADPAFTARGIKVASVCPGWCRTDMGGADAHRSSEQGAASILWPWEHVADGDDINASFTRDGERQAW